MWVETAAWESFLKGTSALAMVVREACCSRNPQQGCDACRQEVWRWVDETAMGDLLRWHAKDIIAFRRRFPSTTIHLLGSRSRWVCLPSGGHRLAEAAAMRDQLRRLSKLCWLKYCNQLPTGLELLPSGVKKGPLKQLQPDICSQDMQQLRFSRNFHH